MFVGRAGAFGGRGGVGYLCFSRLSLKQVSIEAVEHFCLGGVFLERLVVSCSATCLSWTLQYSSTKSCFSRWEMCFNMNGCLPRESNVECLQRKEKASVRTPKIAERIRVSKQIDYVTMIKQSLLALQERVLEKV
ncbi:hypothetical protein TNCV_2915671 [Trichonephila clavipes]|nr:hypothetical protein TNCV_2915671 [Trichonephila clavipes]